VRRYKKVKSVPVLDYAQCQNYVLRSGGIAPHIPNFDTGWRSVVSFMTWPLWSGERGPGTHWIRHLGGPQAGLNMVMKR
jgi:hypothetical protein